MPAEPDPTPQAPATDAASDSEISAIARGRVFLFTAMALIVAFTLFNNWIDAPASDFQGTLSRLAGTALLLAAFHRAYHGSGFFMGLLKLAIVLVGLSVVFVLVSKYMTPMTGRRVFLPNDISQIGCDLAIYSYLVWTFFISRSVATFWKSRQPADPFARPSEGD